METKNYTETLDTLTLSVKEKFVMLPQYIYSSDKEFNKAIGLELELDDNDYYDDIFSQKTEKRNKVMRLYYKLMDEGCTEAGINLMTMLFRIYHETGKLKEEYYSTLNKLFATEYSAASFFLALDWIVNSNKEWKDDFTVQRGYELMSTLAEYGRNSFANLFYECKWEHERLEDNLATLW